MNNKFALAISFLIFSFSLSVRAGDVPTEVVISGTRTTPPAYVDNPGYNQETTQNTMSSGMYYGEDYAKAMAQKAAGEAKGRKMEACYKQLASLDSSKFACSEDGELIDVVEVTGVKDTGNNSAPSLVDENYYNEIDNTRPEPPANWPKPVKPESCDANAIAVKLSACKLAAADKYGEKQNACIAAGAVVFTASVVGGVYLSLRARDPSVVYTRSQTIAIGGGGAVVGAYIGEIVGNMVRDGCTGHYSAARDVEVAQCDLDEKTKIQECANYN